MPSAKKGEDAYEKESPTISPPKDTKEIIEVFEVIDTVVVPVQNESTVTTEAVTKDDEHRLQKRSPLRGDNPNNDLLAELENLKYENDLSSIAARRIKFLPTFLG